ncbi:MAG TPA: rhamnogalacturonan lyase, partial [Niabella sp.]|nr:rhamnogalacturonan lyase [Niabella sp.]
MKHITLILLLWATSLASISQRIMENLNRGLVAVPDGTGKVFISWRLLASDPEAISFNIYRKTSGTPVKLNQSPVSQITSFVDDWKDSVSERTYIIRTVQHGIESKSEEHFVLKNPVQPYLSILLQIPPGYAANDGSIGDLDGDGEYELIVHITGRGHDNSHAGFTDEPLIQAYKLNGQLLWTINLGKNIREGAHYTQFMVYDLDGDGRAEIAMKTADGSKDAWGRVIGDPNKDWRNDKGYILAGPEYLSVFNGLTGELIHTTDFIPPRAPMPIPTTAELKAIWGDGYGNRMDRFLAAIAYLDGKHPSLIMSRGYYTRTVI